MQKKMEKIDDYPENMLKKKKKSICKGQFCAQVCPFHKNKLQPKHTAPDNRLDGDSPRL